MGSLDFMMPRGMQRVLAPLLLHPERSFSLSDLIRAAGGGRGATQKVVETLRNVGLIKDRRSGNQRLFTVDVSHPFYPELRSLSMKTFGLADRLRDALRPAQERIDTAFVFGSIASGAADATSDIDLLVVGDVELFELAMLLSDAETDLGRSIHLTLVDAEEWSRWRDEPVGTAILQGARVMVVGDDP